MSPKHRIDLSVGALLGVVAGSIVAFLLIGLTGYPGAEATAILILAFAGLGLVLGAAFAEANRWR